MFTSDARSAGSGAPIGSGAAVADAGIAVVIAGGTAVGVDDATCNGTVADVGGSAIEDLGD
jgi:hypothetical protein